MHVGGQKEEEGGNAKYLLLREAVGEGLIASVVSIEMECLVALSAHTLLPAQMLPLES